MNIFKMGCVMFSVMCLTTHAFAGIRTVPAVEPVMVNNVKYTVSSESLKSRGQRGGYIEAWDTLADKKLWELKVYEIYFDNGLEAANQEIYIKSMAADNTGKLIITNELDEVYEVDPATRSVRHVPNLQSTVPVIPNKK